MSSAGPNDELSVLRQSYTSWLLLPIHYSTSSPSNYISRFLRRAAPGRRLLAGAGPRRPPGGVYSATTAPIMKRLSVKRRRSGAPLCRRLATLQRVNHWLQTRSRYTATWDRTFSIAQSPACRNRLELETHCKSNTVQIITLKYATLSPLFELWTPCSSSVMYASFSGL